MHVPGLKSERLEHILYLMFGWAVAVVPIVYFHNGLVTEYYFSKAVWANFFIPLPLLIYAAVSILDQRFVFPKTRILLPMTALIGFCLLSLLWSPNIYKGFEVVVRVGIGPALFLGAVMLANTRKRIRGMLYLTVWSMAAVSIYGFFQYFEVVYLPKDQYGDSDPSTTIGLTNFVCEYMILHILAAGPLLLMEKRRWARSLLLVGLVVNVSYLIIAKNRAAMLAFLSEIGLLCLILAVFAYRRRAQLGITAKQIWATLAAIVVGLMILLGGTSVGNKVVERFDALRVPVAAEQGQDLNALQTFLQRIRTDASIRFRIETWYQCLKNVFPDNPLVGVGMANIEVEFPRYYTEFLEGMTIRNNTRVVRTHNDWVQALVDLGVIGFVLLNWLLIQIVRTAYFGLKYSKNRDDFYLWIATGIGFVGYGVEMFFAFPLEVPTSSLWLFFAAGLSASYTRILQSEAEGNVAKGYYVIDLHSPSWKTPAMWTAFAILAGTVLMMEKYAYDFLVAEVRNKEARVYKRYQKWDEANGLLTEAIEHYPWMEGYYYDRAVVKMQQNNLDEALADLRMTSQLVPNYAMGRKQIGMLAARMDQTELAVNEFRKTMEIYKQQREELTDLIARTALKGRRPDLAIPALEETLSWPEIQLENRPQLLRLLADAYGMRGDAVGSLRVFDELKTLGQWDTNIRIRYALSQAQLKRVTEAEEQLRAVLIDAPNAAEAHYALGRILNDRGAYKEALSSLTKAAKLDPQMQSKLKADPALRRDPAIAKWLDSL